MADPKVLDQPWRVWASVAIGGILLAGILLGILLIPVLQGRSAGLDAFTAICRAIGILPGSPAQPQPSDRTPPSPVSQVAWTPQVLQVLAQANTERGRAKAVDVCAPCHGAQGVSTDPATPNLNGQSGAAIYKQLHDYRSGSRVHEVMTGIAQSLGEGEVADLAAYFAGQPKRNPNPSTMSGRTPEAVQLVELGDPKRGLPPCASCHRPGSGGPIEAPILAEQNRDYLVRQLQMYASGERRNDVYARMRTIAAKLTPDEINALALYYWGGFR